MCGRYNVADSPEIHALMDQLKLPEMASAHGERV